PLSVPADIWKFVNHAPEQYAFVVEGDKGNLRTLEVADLAAQIAEERATLHPETYRLEWNGER
ncbi:MAG TPA: hypothetical protein P5069_09760, partial [Candidatus Hydrogenedentes bacterium]|nr:hypothetical protein [Candidatus Hydrogenedentota bacterium]